MTAFQLAGVALAALLSENFILVNCLGIGTRTKAFQDPLDAWRTGVSLTAVMTLTALLSWLLDQLLQHFALGYFQTGCGSRPAVLFEKLCAGALPADG